VLRTYRSLRTRAQNDGLDAGAADAERHLARVSAVRVALAGVGTEGRVVAVASHAVSVVRRGANALAHGHMIAIASERNGTLAMLLSTDKRTFSDARYWTSERRR
jgi:hypothetical protein